jgi:DNA-3-methyladenine glycosylase
MNRNQAGTVGGVERLPRAKLQRGFYRRPATEVAMALLGCWLVRRHPGRGGGSFLAGRIVETEAYAGESDRACHAAVGRTARNAVMYGPPGHAYVYFIYGMYDMMNVVCQPSGIPEAVLIRALEPACGVEIMQARRGVRRVHDIASGPGKLCRALGITRTLNGVDLRGEELWIVAGGLDRDEGIARGPRIGVDYAGRDARRPYRFWLEDNPHVSRRLPSRKPRQIKRTIAPDLAARGTR